MTIVVFVLALVALVIVVSAVRAFFRGLRGENEGRAAFPSGSSVASSNFEPLTRAKVTPSKAMRDTAQANQVAAAEASARRTRAFQERVADQQRTAQRMNEDIAKRNRAMTQAANDQANKWAKRDRDR